MRKALCVGINSYLYINPLQGCANDASDVANTLWRNDDGSLNFDVKLKCATNNRNPVTRSQLRELLDWLYEGDPEIALFYFSGHGGIDTTGGYLCTSEITCLDEGFSLNALLSLVKTSRAKEKIIILDCCHSGFAGSSALTPELASLPEGTTILAACRSDETSIEIGNHGLFTSLLVDALMGGAMNLLGEVTPGSVYSYIDSSLGAWDQHPVFKANVNTFVSLRKNTPPISLAEIRKITDYFFTPTMLYHLDPTYETDKNYTDNKEVNKAHEEIFKLLRKYSQLNLVVPVDEEYMYWAAINSKACKLTALGQFYWTLVNANRI